MLGQVVKKLVNRENLSLDESYNAAKELFITDNAPLSAAFLSLLSAKGETVDEFLGIVKVAKEQQMPITVSQPALDIVGTGGDGANTVNISTAAAILAASCRVKVVKHGNRASTSSCGSADVLEQLGVNLYTDETKIQSSLAKYNIGFFFAQMFHPSFAHIKSTRKALGIPTCFNLMGPLLNPAQADYLIVGVANKERMNLLANVLAKMNVKKALLVHGDGIDELTTHAITECLEIIDGKITQKIIDPEALGFEKCQISDLAGGDKMFNARKILDVLEGEQSPLADTLILNAAVAVELYGITDSLLAAISLVRASIVEGKALATLKGLVQEQS
ncbi:anthranilate phosphoribosyltransferase [Piscirickettsia litoralis]|uniref:Anthranilate phosphoribosyltransferase n=1 Tax=Piscirickettsia litoralis TaxID=1891921 RepID=A0ABX3AA36_9GAMM|nr:anthranilate phosphoribosyltransferase [Piscirickettsia litoralis]ODN42989.1 anthranilate phosphoribosyltransferase [Piscirickettsia litoralis]